MKTTEKLCPMCGGDRVPGRTTFSADLGSGVVVVRQVRATVCNQCGEEWLDNSTTRRLEEIVQDARSRRLQVEVATFE